VGGWQEIPLDTKSAYEEGLDFLRKEVNDLGKDY